MYSELLKQFLNIENLGGKAWQHAMAVDMIDGVNIKDCSMHCFHYQQMLEMLLKHTLETKSKYGAYSHTHNLNKLLDEVTEYTDFNTGKSNYRMALQLITVCAEEYRYNFLMYCDGYIDSIAATEGLIVELLDFISK